jgi:hypothetical protein
MVLGTWLACQFLFAQSLRSHQKPNLRAKTLRNDEDSFNWSLGKDDLMGTLTITPAKKTSGSAGAGGKLDLACQGID